jgi:hypothetical protein
VKTPLALRALVWALHGRHKPPPRPVRVVQRAWNELLATAEIMNSAPHLYPEHEKEVETC